MRENRCLYELSCGLPAGLAVARADARDRRWRGDREALIIPATLVAAARRGRVLAGFMIKASGNNYRVVVIVRYRDGKIFVRWVMTHREYDHWCKLYKQGKV